MQKYTAKGLHFGHTAQRPNKQTNNQTLLQLTTLVKYLDCNAHLWQTNIKYSTTYDLTPQKWGGTFLLWIQ